MSINECSVLGQGSGFCKGILAATAVSTTRTVVLRSRTPTQPSMQAQKENSVNVHTNATASNQATPLVTPLEKLKQPPPPPLSQASAALAPLTTTTTATPMKKKPPPLQLSALSKKVEKSKTKKKKQHPPKPKPQRKPAPLPRVALPDASASVKPEPGFVCNQEKYYCTRKQRNCERGCCQARHGVEDTRQHARK